jgi:hypothetical protein
MSSSNPGSTVALDNDGQDIESDNDDDAEESEVVENAGGE